MSGPDGAKATRQAARLRAALREREARVQELERRLGALETSVALQFGRLVAGAARNPRRRGPRLPKELYRLWRKRNGPEQGPAPSAGERLQLDRIDRPEDRLLAAAPHDGIVIAGIFAPATAIALREHAKVIPLYPHDAAIVLDTADVDLVLVDAAAGEPGGPWAYLGVPGMYDRDRALHDVRALARARSLPLVLWGEAPPATLALLDWDATAATPGRLAGLADPAYRAEPGGTGAPPPEMTLPR
ncbi:hypothetical protein [Actinomadura verrucosospora]|uniref:Uncharacterized protein n=1 Tax=Actinomadura verrucosospora TaxID=46165 RepID=A0A7D4A4P3_ACTVE|nr:hypothetical protein [Actinomadura verrucosospora]QKG25104.1 hypothetical protein ACTIVE_6755 [Actinomadura verrucosospora]